MALHVKMKNPETGKIEILSPQNALDMEQHSGWKRIGHVKVKDRHVGDPQDVLDGAGHGGVRRTTAANASRDEPLDVDEEEVTDLDEVDLEDADDEDTDADAEDNDEDAKA